MISQADTLVNEVTGTVSTPFGNPLFDVVRNGTLQPAVLTVTGALANRGTNAVLNFTGSSLGTTGNTARIVIPGQATTGFIGAFAVSGNEFAKYNNTIDTGAELGVTPFVAADYTAIATEAGLTTGVNGKITANAAALAPIQLTADRSVGSLNLQPTTGAAVNTANIDTNGFTLTVESGGILSSAQTANIIGTAAGGLTAGTTAGSQLFITNNATLQIDAVIKDNAAGAVTLVKSGTGVLNLINPPGVINGAGGVANTYTGGTVINNGVLNVSRGIYLGTGPITLAGGQLEINQPNTVVGVNLTGFGQAVNVVGNATLAIDDNGNGIGGQELSDAASADFDTAPLGLLTISGPHTLSMGGFTYDLSFSGATFSGTPSINLLVRDANFAAVNRGAQTGSGFNLLGGTGSAAYVIGNGSSDTTASSGLTSAITLLGGFLRVDKANGTDAIGDGAGAEDIIINGGTLAWGTGHFLGATSNTSAPANSASGQENINDNVGITLLSGSLGVAGQFNNETFGTLKMLGGTLNPGLGTMRVAGVATISSGVITFNAGGTFSAGTLNLLGGAPDINLVVNNYGGGTTNLTIGAGGLAIAGQNINLGTVATGFTVANGASGSVVTLGGNLAPGNSPGRINTADLTLASGSNLPSKSPAPLLRPSTIK